jgi:Fe-S-cluster-containing dehydrogenase component
MAKTGAFQPHRSRIHVFSHPEEQLFVPVTCQQCDTPACGRVCPEEVIKKNWETGIVDLDQSECIGCRLCVRACRFGTITYLREERIISKCDLCGGDPECVKVCTSGALTYEEPSEVALEKCRAVSRAILTSCVEGQVR